MAEIRGRVVKMSIVNGDMMFAIRTKDGALVKARIDPEKLGGDIPYQRNVALLGEYERGILMADTIDIQYD